MAMTIGQMTAHCEELAAKHNIRIVWTRMDIAHSCADSEAREVYVPPITDGAVYAAVLHEMGHIAHPRGVLMNRNDAPAHVKLREERNAWAWARYMAKEWTDLMDYSERHAMATYHESLRQEQMLQATFRDIIDAINQSFNAGRNNQVEVTKKGQKP